MAVILFVAAAYVISYYVLELGAYVLVLLVFGWLGAFFIDLILAWTGQYRDYRPRLIAAFITVSFLAILVPFVAESDRVIDGLLESMALSLPAIFGIVFEVGMLPTSPALYLLRNMKGLITSGSVEDGILACRVPATFAQTYGDPVVESQLRGWISSSIGYSGKLSHTRKEKSRIGFNILKAGDIMLLYRLEKNAAEILCVPLDGIVARFEKTVDYVPALRFLLVEVLGFADPIQFPVEGAVNRGVNVYERMIHPSKRWITATIYFVVGVASGIAFAFVMDHLDDIWNGLADERLSRGLQSIAAIVVILGTVAGLLMWIQRRAQKKE